MLVFAWIVWSAILIYSLIRCAMFFGVVCANNEKETSFETLWPRIVIRTATFVFLSILIFGGYL